MRDLAVVDMEADSYLLPLNHLVGQASVIWIDHLVPLLRETLHELF